MEYRMREIAQLVGETAIKMGVNPEVAKAILIAENTGSGVYNPEQMLNLGTTSPKGARGFGQVMPDTWAGLVREGYLSPEDRPNTKEGQVKALVAALAEKRKYAGDDPVRLAIAYNAGPKALARYKPGDLSALPAETQGYIPKVMKNLTTTTSSSTYPAGVFDNVLSTVQQATDRGQELLGKIQGVTNSFVDDAKIASNTLAKAGETGAQLELLKGQKVVDQQSYIRNLMTAVGVESETAAQSFQQKAREIAAAQDQVRALQPQIQELRSVSFLDDPLKWVQAQFQLEAVTTKHNALAKSFNDNVAAVGALQQMGNRQIAIQPGLNTDAVGKEAKLAAESKKLEADFKLLQISQATRQAQLAAYTTELQIGQQNVTSAFQLAKLTADKVTQREADAAKTVEEQNFVALNAWRERIGLNRYGNIAEMKLIPKAELEKQMRYALRPSLSIAATPGDSLNALVEYKGYDTFRAQTPEPGRKFLDTYIDTTRRTQQALKLQPGNTKLSDDDLFTKAGDAVAELWNKDRKIRDYASMPPDNPFAMNASIYAQEPALKDNPLAQYAKAAPNAGAGLAVKDILSHAIARVQAGNPPEVVAAEVKQFFEVGMRSQFEAYRMGQLGFDIRNPDTNKMEFPVSGNVFGLWDRISDPRKTNAKVKNFDLLNPAELQQFLIMNTVAAKYKDPANTTVQDMNKRLFGNMSRDPGGATQ